MAAIPEPVSQFKKLPGRCTKVTYFLFPATPETGNDKLFMHINTTTFVVNLIHTSTSKVKFTARYPVCYHFTIRPFAVDGWTDGGANEGTWNQFIKRAAGPK